MEHQSEENLRCECGEPRDESMAFDAGYDAEAVRCKSCEAIEASARAFRGIDEIDPAAGIKWRAEPGATDGDLA